MGKLIEGAVKVATAKGFSIERLREVVKEVNSADVLASPLKVVGKGDEELIDGFMRALESVDPKSEEAKRIPDVAVQLYNDYVDVMDGKREDFLDGQLATLPEMTEEETSPDGEGEEGPVEEQSSGEEEKGSAEESPSDDDKKKGKKDVKELSSEVKKKDKKTAKKSSSGSKKTAKKKDKKPVDDSKYTRSHALVESLKTWKTKDEAIKEANELYVKNGGADKIQVSKALLGYVLPTLRILNVIETDTKGRMRIKS